jgi:hypothetical protein
LCSCGKSNDPLIKRDPPIVAKKEIPIRYLDDCHKSIGEDIFSVEGIEGNTSISINNLKEAISKDRCDIVYATYWDKETNSTLTEKPIKLDKVDKIDLICFCKVDNVPTATPIPSLPVTPPPATATPAPIPTESPEVQPTVEPKEEEYSWSDAIIVTVVTAIILVLTVVYVIKGGKNGRKVAKVNGQSQMHLIHTRTSSPTETETNEATHKAEVDPDVARLRDMVLPNNEYNIRLALRLVIKIASKNKLNQLSNNVQRSLLQDCEIMLEPSTLKSDFKLGVKAINALGRLEKVRGQVVRECARRGLNLDAVLAERSNPPTQPAREEAQQRDDWQILNKAMHDKDLTTVVGTITRLHSENLTRTIPNGLREEIYNYLKGRLCELARQKLWPRNEGNIFTTIVRAIYRIGLYERLMSEQQQMYINNSVPTARFMKDSITGMFADVTEIEKPTAKD